MSATATTVSVGYTNSAGTASRSTGATASLSGYITGRLIQMPLQAGDVGVQKIDSVTIGGTVATAGTVNVILARPLWEGGRVPVVGAGGRTAPTRRVCPCSMRRRHCGRSSPPTPPRRAYLTYC